MSANDENIKKVLEKAAADQEFLERLLDNREAALAGLELTPEEKLVLLAAADEQLRKMVAEARRKPWHQMGPAVKVLGGVAVAAAAAAVLIPSTLGISPEVADSMYARSALREIHEVQQNYMQEYETYGTLESLLRDKDFGQSMEAWKKAGSYTFEIRVGEKTFTAIARHKTRPETRPAFKIGPGGKIEKIEKAAD